MSKEENSDGAAQEGPGGEASKKDDIYENQGTKKIIRLVTVMAYMFSVSFVAIVLSAYYLFLWEPPNPRLLRRPSQLSDPEIQFLISDQEIIQDEPSKPGQHANATYISFSNRFDDAETFVNNDHSKNRENLKESLFLLRKSLIESFKNKINDSKSSVQNSAQENRTSNSLNYTTSKKEKTMNLTRRSSGKDARNSSKIMNRMFGNNGTSQILESSTISGDEVNNDHFTNTRNHSVYETSRDIFRLNHSLMRNIVTNQYKKDVLSNFNSEADTPNKKSVKVKTPQYPAINNEEDLDIQKSREDRTYNVNNISQATDLNEQSTLDFFRNSEFANHPEHPEQSNQSSVKLANIALKFKETQTEKMTIKLLTVANEQSSLSEVTTTPRQKDLLTILTEIAESSTTPLPTTFEDLQTSLSTETKEISTKMHSNVN
ncbi:hypothetical protein E2986_11168 [Frieseomelitta varia]|uniref:Uncharacterized protein n=1 Tax=Frieseomelitta varia TaxID=561572 RepID=A0A833W032_9HYME|nr:uncharacterized protein LOC122529048 [Frieseomelitta varia]KAF3427094.1 hypothetical protein E2986_11168 [Frieseomelitta varia]